MTKSSVFSVISSDGRKPKNQSRCSRLWYKCAFHANVLANESWRFLMSIFPSLGPHGGTLCQKCLLLQPSSRPKGWSYIQPSLFRRHRRVPLRAAASSLRTRCPPQRQAAEAAAATATSCLRPWPWPPTYARTPPTRCRRRRPRSQTPGGLAPMSVLDSKL